MGAHALLSPSSAHRWLNCPAAPRLEEGIEDTGSDFAAEGTLAHAYCAMKLKDSLGQSFDAEMEEIESLYEQYHTGEMDEYTDTYETIVLEKFNSAKMSTPDAQLLVETRLDFSNYIPDSFGTADAIIIEDGTMEVIDFKYGKGVKVSAFENPQMMIYALGALDKFDFEYNISKVRMTIIQPRIDNLSEYELSVTELTQWAEKTLKPTAKLAYSGKGEQKAGDWCRFCKIKSRCAKLSDFCMGKMDACHDPKLVSTELLAKAILPALPIIKSWLSDVEEYALGQALNGVDLPGWKVVEGRSIRKITDVEGAVVALNQAGYKTTEIFKPQELKSLTDLEKLVGKKQFAAICGDYIEKPQGKPTLAPATDKRAAINPAADDFKDINL